MIMSNQHLRTRLAELNTEIAEAQALLKRLEHDRRDVQQLKLIVYPVLTLPVEVLLEILVHCNCSHRGPRDYWSSTIVLRVCRSWRELALDASTLWARIDFDLTKTHTGMWSQAMARGHPLSVRLCGDLVKCLGSETFCALLHRVAPRLQTLELEVEAKGMATLDRNPPSFPLLQKLAVIHEEHDELRRPKPVKHLFLDAPRLQHVFTRSIHITFDWKQLTKFEGDSIFTKDAWQLLQSGENLVECSLSFFDNGKQPSVNDLDPCFHPHLQTLTLRDFESYSYPPRAYPSFLHLLTLPALRNLYLSRISRINVEQVSTFLLRHSAQLRTLSSMHGDMEFASIESLRCMPHLRDLELEFWDGKNTYVHDFFRELEDSKPFLPQIQRISFKTCKFILDPLDVEMVTRGLTSRWDAPADVNGVARIRSFHIDLWPKDNRTDMADEFHQLRPSLAGLEALVKRGMHIYVGTRSMNYLPG
ncbi:hypothetical protein DFH06DRAFT_747212 [Mycena polygramma]|nr:hypothetical protein DFH06DRAFT_747212 [Mycena polygramma]